VSTTTSSRRSSRSGETIRFAASTRAQAESLAQELTEFAPQLVREGGTWLVEIDPDRHLTPLLLKVFQSVSTWLTRNGLASVEVHFGDSSTYTLLHPSAAQSSHSAEFLLQRVIQLQTALESRVAIEQATGLLAGRLRIAVGDAFEILRHGARRAGRQLHELAEEIVSSDELPPEIKRALDAWRRRR
jgi:hypothetical protein